MSKNVMSGNEAFSRVVIDRKLREQGWDIEDNFQVVFEDHGPAGRSDYVLKDSNGHAIALIEAKSPDIDPYVAKEQARAYADSQYPGKVHFIFLANDHTIYFWNLAEDTIEQVQDFFSQGDLERRRDTFSKKGSVPLSRIQITPDYFTRIDINNDITLRPYQVAAWEAIAESFDNGKRSFLLEMATGTGKTVLSALLIRGFLEANQAQNVLFIVDRIELATQTKGTFEKLLGDLTQIGIYYGQKKERLLGVNVVVATIQSLISHGKDHFSPGYFDMVIHDEAHRSIYSARARGAVDYFNDVVKIGLTATPRDYLKNVDPNDPKEQDSRRMAARIQRDTYT
jgi:type I restriction enzyme R subunit